ncbi:MAG: hypothetical protein ACK4NA_16445 [Alphaproteobacteria bacterium]
MKRRVVDSNVPIVANGGDAIHVSKECRLNALEALNEIVERGRVIVDSGGEIIREYRRHLNPRGQPGVGDRFFQQVLMDYSGKVERVEITPHATRVYEEFPDDPALEAFDPSDRKFVAVALKGKAIVVNATDSDWLNYKDSLKANGVSVEFVCGRSLGLPD